jgi:hypothetical protein
MQPKVTVIMMTAKPMKPEPKPTAVTKPATVKSQKKEATSVKPWLRNPQPGGNHSNYHFPN